ncbi:hypothetical protein [Bifidobacterium longum]|uniref:hypothetical protein n=1 Tax=Bifidobacterium longum TaxID=216816 RepID=UPI0012D2CA29|nr:hypothetical protein [Bifidobacterium longum]
MSGPVSGLPGLGICCSSMAAMLLARIPDPSWSRKLAVDLLNADMESYARHVRELAES